MLRCSSVASISNMSTGKRPAEEALDLPSPKKMVIEGLPIHPLIEDMDDTLTNQTTPQTPVSDSHADAESIHTTATTPRPKFPSDLKTLPCPYPDCPKTFNRPARLRDHLNSHNNSRPFKCPYEGCTKDYIEDKHLKQHIKGTHTLERKHVCTTDGCGKSFATGTRLKRHQAVHEGRERFKCEVCGQSFRKRDTLNTHVRKEHLKVRPFLCAEKGCGADFDTRAALRRHKDREHGEIKFWCTECALLPAAGGEEGETQRVGFTTEALLLQHVKSEHQNCLFCDFHSSSRSQLETHVEIHHSGKSVSERRTEACPVAGCKKSFTRASNLTAHIKSAHQGIRFICGVDDVEGLSELGWDISHGCGDRFASKARLEDHIRYRHLSLPRPRLTQPESTIDPIELLTGSEKQTISCPQCHEVFLRYHDLDLHITRHHSRPEQMAAPSAGMQFMAEDEGIWGADVPDEEIFAGEPDGRGDDDWAEDEANILLLARDPGPDADDPIDPAILTSHF